jgi:hypothetical protein
VVRPSGLARRPAGRARGDQGGARRFFLNIPTQEAYRELILAEHGALRDSAPLRYKRFIRSGDDSHTALQSARFYLGEANGVPLWFWTHAFVNHPASVFWIDLVEPFVPLP